MGRKEEIQVCVCGQGKYTGLFIPPGEIIRNMLPLVKENLEGRQSPRGESCLKNENIVVER